MAPPSTKYAPPSILERNELQKIEIASCEMTDESLRATREMLRLTHATQDAGAATLAMIHQQGEQLKRTEDALDSMHAELQQTETTLIQMERTNCCFCGVYFQKCCLCCSGRHKEANPNVWTKKSDQSDSPVPVLNQPKSTQRPMAEGDFIPRITNDAREDEMNSNLIGVSHIVGDLKNQAIDMNSEITKQNDGLDRMNKKAESNQARLQSAQFKTDNLIKS